MGLSTELGDILYFPGLAQTFLVEIKRQDQVENSMYFPGDVHTVVVF